MLFITTEIGAGGSFADKATDAVKISAPASGKSDRQFQKECPFLCKHPVVHEAFYKYFMYSIRARLSSSHCGLATRPLLGVSRTPPVLAQLIPL